MFNEIILQLEAIIKFYGWFGLFLVAFLEEIFAFIPSALVAMSAGFFLIPFYYNLSQAAITALKIAFPLSLGIVLGSLIIYFIAYWGGKPAILRYGKIFGINWSLIEKIEATFAKGYIDEIVLLFARIIPVVPSVAICVFCGLIRYSFVKFILISLIGSFIRATIMALIGWWARSTYVFYANIINKIETLILIAIIFFFIFFLLWHKKKYKI